MTHEQYCPFAKAIFNGCVQCAYALKLDQRTRKVNCQQAIDKRPSCIELNELLLSQFNILDNVEQHGEISYSQRLKLVCGGIAGIQSLLDKTSAQAPDVQQTISSVQHAYNTLSDFPFHELANFILGFDVRRNRRR
ncbi:MAG: hypothetical protein OEZ43_06490 [Gammaproteobacteria bacterium]|nr:hypothetical protein [Gammaproteobacteria bacterium]